MVGEDVFHVERHPALDKLQVLLAGEEARLGEEGGDLARVRRVPKVGLVLVEKCNATYLTFSTPKLYVSVCFVHLGSI